VLYKGDVKKQRNSTRNVKRKRSDALGRTADADGIPNKGPRMRWER
jgi:hypothetical protein